MADPFQYGNEPLDSIKCGLFITKPPRRTLFLAFVNVVSAVLSNLITTVVG